jgi:thioredoxin 1
MAEAKPIVVDDSSFKESVEEASGLSIVDFWAEWCGPCKMIAPVLEEMAEEYAGRVGIFKVDVDSSRETAQRFNIRSIPTLLFFKDGQVVETIIGVRSKKELTETVDRHLN